MSLPVCVCRWVGEKVKLMGSPLDQWRSLPLNFRWADKKISIRGSVFLTPEDPANMPRENFSKTFFPQIWFRRLAAKASRKKSPKNHF